MMYKIDGLTLISAIDIPIPELRVNIHQPTLKEIAYIGERNFYQYAGILTLEKEGLISNQELSFEDKEALSSQSNFQILMSIIQADPTKKVGVQMLLSLLFPQNNIEIEERFIMLVDTKNKSTAMIDENNFEILQSVVRTIACLSNPGGAEEFNPAGEQARKIAERIKKFRAKVKALKGEEDKDEGSIIARYTSALGIGSNAYTLQNLLDLTLYQLFDQLERFSLHSSYEVVMQAKMAGAKDVEDVDWLKNIH